jgi:putative flippase GtrA
VRTVLTKLAGYVCTAGAAAVVDLGGCIALIRLGWSVLPAATASFLLAMLVNYAATSCFVFHRPLSARGLSLFATASLVGLSVNVSVTGAALLLLRAQPVSAKALGIAIAF